MDETNKSAFELGTDGPKSILVGVDMTEPSLRAGAYAAGLARRQSSQLTIVFARQLPAAAMAYDQTGALAAAQLDDYDAVETQLREGLHRYVYDLDIRIEVRAGQPLKVITDIADKVRAECVVVGSSRPGAFLRTGGPLPAHLIRLRRWPVIVVP